MNYNIPSFPEYWDNLKVMIDNHYLKRPHTEEQINCFVNGTVLFSKEISEIENRTEQISPLAQLYSVVQWADGFGLFDKAASWGKTIKDSPSMKLLPLEWMETGDSPTKVHEIPSNHNS